MEARNLVDMLLATVKRSGNNTALMKKQNGRYDGITYLEFSDQIRNVALGLSRIGIRHGDRIALLSENRPEWPIADFGILSVGAINVPLYTTLTPAQIKYILEDSGTRVIIVSTSDLFEKVQSLFEQLPALEKIITIEPVKISDNSVMTMTNLCDLGKEIYIEHPEFYQQMVDNVLSDDLCGIIYTSGTTGAPKGVMLSHGNILSNVIAGLQVLRVNEEDTLLSFLPLSHSFERMAGQFCAICAGATIAYAESIETIAQNFGEVCPTVVATVPRVLEKVYTRVIEQAEAGSAIKRKIFWWAVKIGEKYVRARKSGRISALLNWQYFIATHLVFQKLKNRLGGRMRFFASGGAPLPKDIGEFFYRAGILILEGYGLTETSPVITVNHEDAFKFGAVGKIIPGVEAMIANDGEILTRGPHVMKGYYQNPEATLETIDSDGWLHTGDIGYFDEEGFLHITDRKKNIIVTSGGKNVTPSAIESKLVSSPYIEQVMVVGDARNYLTALIVPNFDTLEKYAHDNGLIFNSRDELVSLNKIYQLIEQHVQELLCDFARFEQIKKFTLLTREFTLESGEMTPTLKMKRKIIAGNYVQEINAMYNN
ncbi:long-chain fatty acid--CoA ligase [candidate division KSB1 bacterium]|nr:long-chain fatty acid--CoA ligase [candidate division KSB1 bacterium]